MILIAKLKIAIWLYEKTFFVISSIIRNSSQNKYESLNKNTKQRNQTTINYLRTINFPPNIIQIT